MNSGFIASRPGLNHMYFIVYFEIAEIELSRIFLTDNYEFNITKQKIFNAGFLLI